MSEQQIRIGIIWIKVVGFILIGLLSIIFYFMRGISIANDYDHEQLLKGQHEILQMYTEHDRKLAAIEEWKKMVEQNMKTHNTRGGKTSTIKDELINSYSVYGDSASFTFD